VIRRAPLVLTPAGGPIEPAFSTAVVARYFGMSPDALSAAMLAGQVPAGARGEPMSSPAGQLWRINFVGPARSFLTIPAGSVLALADPDVAPAPDNPLRGKIVVVGGTFRDSRDFHNTPYGLMPGVEIHANLAHMILNRSFIRTPAWILGFALQLLVVLAAGVAVAACRPIVATLACVVGPFIVGVPASFLAFRSGGYWVDFMLPALATQLFSTAGGFLERQRIRDAFSRYVSSEIAARVLRESPSLAGERREVSVLFSDLRDFTSLSEPLDPSAIAKQLSEYFRAMTATIFEHRGMINDFIGDGIMATFGAPLDDPEHALHAVRAAIAMQQALLPLNARWIAAGSPPLRMGIGLHTGTVFAGNVGGPLRIKYALVGDVVNLASRVQGLNKELGTRILFTEATRSALGVGVEVRDYGPIPIKGRSEPVHVHELVALNEGAGAAPA
jgi:adenylate cyclase